MLLIRGASVSNSTIIFLFFLCSHPSLEPQSVFMDKKEDKYPNNLSRPVFFVPVDDNINAIYFVASSEQPPTHLQSSR